METAGNGWQGREGALPPDPPTPPLGFFAPHLHGPVDAEVMQERVLHLGQHLAEELEHLLPHAWRVLRAREQRLSGQEAVPPAWSTAPVPPFLPPSLLWGHLLHTPPPLTVETGLP